MKMPFLLLYCLFHSEEKKEGERGKKEREEEEKIREWWYTDKEILKANRRFNWVEDKVCVKGEEDEM